MGNAQLIGYIVNVIAVFPLFASGFMYIFKAPLFVKNMEHVGYPVRLLPPMGVIKIAIAALTLVPATSFIGVILATGWMGGAISAHVRVSDKYFVQVTLLILIWIGFGLRHQTEMHALLGF